MHKTNDMEHDKETEMEKNNKKTKQCKGINKRKKMNKGHLM